MKFEIYFGSQSTNYFVDYNEEILIDVLLSEIENRGLRKEYGKYGNLWLKLIND